MTVVHIENLEKRLLSNNAKLLLLRRQPQACKDSRRADTLIENLSYINEQADAHGDTLLSVCSLLMREVIDEIFNTDIAPEKAVIDKAITWHEQARRYVKNPEDQKAVTSLINKMPNEFHAEMKDYIDHKQDQTHSIDVNTNNNLLNFDEALNLDHLTDTSELTDADPWNSEFDFDNGNQEDTLANSETSLLIMLADEFSIQIYNISNRLIAELNDSIECTHIAGSLEYSESAKFKELIQSCKETKLVGLQRIFEFVFENLSALSSAVIGKRDLCVNNIQSLPQKLNNHLLHPDEDALILDLVDSLTQNGWLRDLAYREEKNLVYGLVSQQEVEKTELNILQDEITLTATDVSLDISEEASTNLVDSFFAESDRYAEQLTSAIANIVKGSQVEANVRTAQRLSHTLKGSANLLGVKGIANLAHYLEDIFEILIHDNSIPNKLLAESMQEAADTIENMIECLAERKKEPENSLAILQSIIDWIPRLRDSNEICILDTEQPKAIECGAKPISSTETANELTFVRALSRDDSDPELANTLTEQQNTDTNPNDHLLVEQGAETTHASQTTEVLRVPKQLIDNILNLVGETSISLGQMQEKLLTMTGYGHNIRSQDRVLQSKRFELEELINIQGLSSQQSLVRTINGREKLSNFDSLELDEYNEFYGATHSYIETVADSRTVTRKVIQEVDELETLFIQQKRLNHALQEMVMSTRMVAASTISARLQRSLRQAARMTGKEVELVIYGEHLLIDGDLLAQLVDPLMHVLRNAVDHGIESKDVRFENGKNPVGKVILRYYQEGSHLVVQCSDDGAGLDYEKIVTKARAKGLIQDRHLERAAIARLILSPGFSTRDNVTQVSGRGVGMDAVNAAVAKMKGSLSIKDQSSGQTGTVIELRLPVTLLTNHSILVKSLDKQFAIPTNTLSQILTPGAGYLEMMGDRLSYVLEKNIYPAVLLNGLIGAHDEAIQLSDASKQRPVLLLDIDGQVHAVIIDSVSAAVELVVKGFGPYVGDVEGVLGVSLLGNGEIIPVIDLPQLMRQHTGSTSHLGTKSGSTFTMVDTALQDNDSMPASLRVLIVDDSLSARDNLAELARDAGHTPILARDGLEALALINKAPPDLVLTDLEMPRMNGLELTTHIKSNQSSKHIPVVMITSRSMQKHREEAKKAGVDEYITKPYLQEDLMMIVNKNLIQNVG